MSIRKKLLREIAGVLERTEGDGQLFLKVTYKGTVAESFTHSFSSSKYLSRLEASPDEPLRAAEEKFVTAHAAIQGRKKHIVDPLGILDGSYKPPKEAVGRATARSSSGSAKAKKPGR